MPRPDFRRTARRAVAALAVALAVQPATAQVVYTDGENRSAPLLLTAPLTTLGITTGLATQTGAIVTTAPGLSIEKVGAGTLILAGTNGYTGGTTVSAGALLVNGSIVTSSTLTVAPAGLIGGTGEVPTAVVDGTLAPGQGIGTLTVRGDLTLSSSARYVVEVAATGADRSAVDGTAKLDGTLRLVPVGPLVFGQPTAIVTAGTAVIDTFRAVDSALGTAIRPSLRYEANRVVLTLEPLPLGSVLTGSALSPNQAAVAGALDRAAASGANLTGLIGLYRLPVEALPRGLDQLSGVVHAGGPWLGVTVSDGFLTLLTQRWRRRPAVGGVTAFAADAAFASAATIAATQAAEAAGVTPPLDPQRFSLWASAFGTQSRITGDALEPTRRERTNGLSVGGEWLVTPDAQLGFALAGGGARSSLDRGLGSLSAEVFQAGLYGSARFGAIELAAAGTYAYMAVDSTRAMPDFGISAINASYGITVWGGRVEALAPVAVTDGLSVAPVAAVNLQHVRMPAFAETSTEAAAAPALLAVDRSASTTVRSELGVRIEGRFAVAGLEGVAHARAAWGRYVESSGSVTVRFVDLPDSAFSITGVRPDRNAALVSTGFELRLTSQLSLGAQFDGEFSRHVSEYGGSARLRLAF